MGHDLLVLGDLVVDLIVPIERLPLEPNRHGWAEGIFPEPGGAGNVLVAARRLGLSTAALGHLGGDPYGAEMLAMLEAEGVDMGHISIAPERKTVICIVLADTLHQHVYLGIKDDLGLWPFPDRWHAVIRGSRALYTDGYTLRDLLSPDAIFSAFATARNAGVPVFYDPGPSVEFLPEDVNRQAIASSDFLLIAEPEAAMLSDSTEPCDLARDLRRLGATTVVLKLGAAGCLVATSTEMIDVPGFTVPVVDTVGAGDSFAAAFIAGILRGGSLRASATLANAMGALVATQRGAGTRIPPRESLLDLLEDNPEASELAGDG